VNEYLNSARAFCNWMVAQGRMAVNPLAKVDRVEERGKQTERRALTVEEVERLLAVAGDRGIHYLAAAHTGLRRMELEGIKWGDLVLNNERPIINVRAAITKNKKTAVIYLHPQLVEALVRNRPSIWDGGDLVFSGGLPHMRDMRKDFDNAGIAAIDTQGRKADFHSLRKTCNMGLLASGASLPTVMTIMRHSDPRLTAKTYTDATLLPQREAINNLPWYGKKGTEKGS
jgi:integrase